MAIYILKKPIVDKECQTSQKHHDFRRQIFSSKSLEGLEEVVSGNRVIEFGCGIFGGLAEKVLELGCQSYLGIDVTIGEPETLIHQSTLLGTDFHLERVPRVVTIPESIANDPRANFIFGIDAFTFFSQVATSSVVTISTGFFDDDYLLPGYQGERYIEKMIAEIARATKRGLKVGFHDFFFDETPDISIHGAEVGLFFRYQFRKCGVYPRPRHHHYAGMWFLGKP